MAGKAREGTREILLPVLGRVGMVSVTLMRLRKQAREQLAVNAGTQRMHATPEKPVTERGHLQVGGRDSRPEEISQQGERSRHENCDWKREKNCLHWQGPGGMLRTMWC